MTEYNSEDQNKKDSLTLLFEKARNQLKQIEDRRQVDVKKIIEELAKALEDAGFQTEMICEEMSLQLTGYCSSRYIRECLEEKYKNKKKDRKNVIENCGTVPQSSDPEPIKISLTTNGKPANHDEEMKQIYHDPERNGNTHDIAPAETILRWMDLARDKDLEIGQLKEQLKEQRDQHKALLESVNAVAEAKKANQKPIPATETLEYKALLSQLHIVQERNQELEQLIKAEMQTNPAIGFQSATNLQRDSNENTTTTQPIANEVEFPAQDLSTFFLDQRQAKQVMYLKIEGNKVIGWESDTKRVGRK